MLATFDRLETGVLLGEFDLLQASHGLTLAMAKQHCRHLWVALASDADLQDRHGKSRPIYHQAERAEMLRAVRGIESVICLREGFFEFPLEPIPPAPWKLFHVLAAGMLPSEQLQAWCCQQGGYYQTLEGPWDEVTATQKTLAQIFAGRPASAFSDVIPGLAPILTQLEEVKALKQAWQDAGHSLITTNGSFDLLHPGHLRYLQQAKDLGGKLVVLVNDDASVRERKGLSRPIFCLEARLSALAMLKCVDAVIPFHEDTPLVMLEHLKPAWHVKGGSFEPERIATEKSLVESWGGSFRCFPLSQGFSSTETFRKITAV